MLNGKHLTGIGNLEFLGANQIPINEEFAGVNIMYQAIHGEEDKNPMLNPIEQDQYVKEFNKIFNV